MEKVNVGDKVHIGHAKKGGAGYSGTVTKIEGTKVWIKLKDDQKRTVVGQMKNLTKEDKTSNTIKKSELKEMIKGIIKSENLMEMAAPKGKFTPEQLNKLKDEYGSIKKIDPANPSYKKLTDLLDSLSKQQLQQLEKEKINFISALARNRINRMKNENVNAEGRLISEARTPDK